MTHSCNKGQKICAVHSDGFLWHLFPAALQLRILHQRCPVLQVQQCFKCWHPSKCSKQQTDSLLSKMKQLEGLQLFKRPIFQYLGEELKFEVLQATNGTTDGLRFSSPTLEAGTQLSFWSLCGPIQPDTPMISSSQWVSLFFSWGIWHQFCYNVFHWVFGEFYLLRGPLRTIRCFQMLSILFVLQIAVVWALRTSEHVFLGFMASSVVLHLGTFFSRLPLDHSLSQLHGLSLAIHFYLWAHIWMKPLLFLCTVHHKIKTNHEPNPLKSK